MQVKLKSKKSVGYAVLLLWCVISALSRVYTSDVEQKTDPQFMAFFCFTIAMLFFLFMAIPNFKTLWRRSLCAWREVLGLNVSTFLGWFFLLYPLKYIEPSLVSTISLGVAPILTVLLGMILYREAGVNPEDHWVAILMMLVIGFIVYLILHGETSVAAVSLPHEIISVLFCFIVGCGVAATSIYGKRLSLYGFAPREVLVVRFWMLFIVSALFYFHSHHNPPMSSHLVWQLLSTSTLLVILPMYLLFVALRYLQPLTASMIFPLMPAMIFFIEFFDARFRPQWEVMIAILAVVFLSIIGSLMRYRNE